jgi:4-amino-4-deoxy-L-arabinose transferase-like glycosyltransferase
MAYFIFILAGLFRLYHIQKGIFFEGELGHNYLAIKNFFVNHSFPLIGPPTSHEWLSFGPLYYWLFGPILSAGGYHPIVGALFFALVGSLVPVIHYFFTKKLFGFYAATLSSLLLAVSPFLLLVTWQSRFFSLVVPLTYTMLYFLYGAKKLSHAQRLIFATFFFGVMLNFHLSPIILLPGLLFHIILNRKKYSRSVLCAAVGVFFIPHIPLLFADAHRGFYMVRQLLLWFPYRIAGFLGLYPKNTIDTATSYENILAILNFLRANIVQVNLSISCAIMLYMIYCVFDITKKSSLKKKTLLKELHIFFIGGLLAIFIHGKPPYHYFLPLVPFIFIYMALIIDYLRKKLESMWVVAAISLLLVFFNVHSSIERDTVMPFVEQEKAALKIIKEAHGQRFSLERIGPNDQFEGNFAQNYQYLLWYYGNEPVKDAPIVFVIRDNSKRVISVDKYSK